MKMPASEIADRFTILLLKVGHGVRCDGELIAYARAWDETALGVDLLVDLFAQNAAIWQLEAQVRQGKEDELGLEEVGRRALAIRDLNAKRIAAKNRIAELTNGFREVKIAHASEETHG